MNDNFIITGINRVVMVGKDEYSERGHSFSHKLSSNELIFHFSGQATVFFDQDVLKTKPYTIRFLPKGRTERYDVNIEERGECIDVFFDADVPISDRAFVIDVRDNEKLPSLFRKLFATWVGRSESYYFESLSLLYRIFAEMKKSVASPRSHLAKIAPAIEIINRDFLTSDVSVSMLSQACGIGESYLTRLFKEIYGLSPKKYIISLKIGYAQDLLRLLRYSVSEIAEMCNFSDVYFFSRQFKSYVGISPSEFVKKYKSSK